MKKLIKILLWLIIIFAIIIVLGVVGLILFFPKEKMKEMAVEKMSTTLDREVTIDGISLSFWGGVGAYLEGIRIANAEDFEKKNFLEAKALDVKLQIWPLLKREIMVDRLILVEPVIELRKLADGRVNYKFGAFDSAAPPEVAERIPEETKLAVSAVSFKNLSIEKGNCSFIDDSSLMRISAVNFGLSSQLETPQASIFLAKGKIEIDSLFIVSDTLVLPPLTVAADYDALYDFAKDSLILSESDVTINGMNFKVTADIPQLTLFEKANVKISSEVIDINKALSFLNEEQKALLADYTVAGGMSITAVAGYDINTADTLAYSGGVEFTNLKLSMKDFQGEFVVNNARAEFKNDFARLDVPEALFQGNKLKAMLRARDFENPYIDGEIDGSMDMAFLNPYLPETGEPKLTGNMTCDIKFDGPVENLSRMKMTGNVIIKDGTYSATTLPEQIRSFDADMKIDSRDIILNKFNVEFESSDMALKGKLANAFPYFIPGYEEETAKPFLTFELKSRRFNVDKLFPEAAPGEGSNIAGLPPDSIPPLILPDINGQGTGKIDTLIYSSVDFTNVTSDITIEDKKVKLKNARGDVYTGKVTGESVIDISDLMHPTYTGTFDAKQIEANDFITRFTNLGGHLFGKLNMSGSFSAAGLEPEDLLKSLTMDGTALFNEARLLNFDLVTNLANQFNFKTFNEETLKNFASSFKVIEGRVQFDALKFFSNFGDWNITGSAGFDGSLDYTGEVLLSEKYSKELLSQSGLVAGLASMLQDTKTERINVPFKLSEHIPIRNFRLISLSKTNYRINSRTISKIKQKMP